MADVDVLIRLQSGGVGTDTPRWAGDLVTHKVRPHGGWGAKEGLPTYGIITVVGADTKAVQDRVKRHHIEYEPDGRTEKFRVRATHWINLDLLAAKQHEDLTKKGALQISAAEFYSRCNDRVASLNSL